MEVAYKILDSDVHFIKRILNSLSRFQVGDLCYVKSTKSFIYLDPCTRNGEIMMSGHYRIKANKYIHTNKYLIYAGSSVLKPIDRNGKQIREEDICMGTSLDELYYLFPFTKTEFPLFIVGDALMAFTGDLDIIQILGK